MVVLGARSVVQPPHRLRAKGSVGQMAQQGWQHGPLPRGLVEEVDVRLSAGYCWGVMGHADWRLCS